MTENESKMTKEPNTKPEQPIKEKHNTNRKRRSSSSSTPRNTLTLSLSKRFSGIKLGSLKEGLIVPEQFSALEPIHIKVINQITDCDTYEKLEKVLSTYTIQFFEKTLENKVICPRMLIWKLEETHRIVLEVICRLLKNKKDKNEILTSILSESQPHNTKVLQQFVDDIFSNESLFEKEGDPSFNDDGEIVTISKECLKELLFKPEGSKKLDELFSYTQQNYFTENDLINLLEQKMYEINTNTDSCSSYTNEQISKSLVILCEINSFDSNTLIQIRKIRMSHKKETFSSFRIAINQSTDEGVKITSKRAPKRIPIKRYNSASKIDLCPYTKLTESQILSTEDKKSPKEVELLSLSKITTESSKDLTISLSNDSYKVEEGNVNDNILGINPKIFAEQLMVYDINLFGNIPLKEIILIDKSPFIIYGTSKLTQIENLVIKHSNTRNGIDYFITVAYKCFKLGDFNMAFIIYSCIIRASYKHSDEFENKKNGKYFNKLAHVFSINQNHRNYREEFNKRNTNERIPVISTWIHDFLSEKEKGFIVDNLLSVYRMKSYVDCVKGILFIHKITLKLQRIDSIQKYLTEFKQ
ncbi:RasGEF domain containing protein [Entamoeba histolytica HM-3:IMSS]|uniref:RasGEF domain containing protein n=1 Tax=Entamoeba histolytica HM-3:IMSS TaxID=885315 RepID=M7WC02_ENTHI|nr:RasGEF domain containing protein [Entamoeba histolytica HM-3:IMSS]